MQSSTSGSCLCCGKTANWLRALCPECNALPLDVQLQKAEALAAARQRQQDDPAPVPTGPDRWEPDNRHARRAAAHKRQRTRKR